MEERETQARWLRFVGASAALVAVAVMAGPAGGQRGARAKVADAMVTATTSNTFEPAGVTINEGEKVTWTNSGGGQHNVVFDDGSFTQPMTPSTDSWTVSRTFSSAGGPFRYYCARHPFMTGTVTVNAVTPPPGGGTPPPGGGNPPPGGGTQPGTPSPGTPGAGKSITTVTLQVSDATPTRGARVRFFGTVKPEQDGRLVQLQRRSRGSFRTVLRLKLSDAGSVRSKFSKRLRVLGDAVFRARLPADSAHEADTIRARRLDVR
jgi:plastocyanin